MERLKVILGTSVLLFSSIINAAIINITNTDTSLNNGNFADLQGLEWLSLDETRGLSRIEIEANVGGFLDDNWRYANQLEVSLLFSSIWGGNHIDGWSDDNYDGAQWFKENFSMLGYDTFQDNNWIEGSYTDSYKTNHDYSNFIYGSETDCLIIFDCTIWGKIILMESYYKDVSSINTDNGSLYITESGTAVGWIRDSSAHLAPSNYPHNETAKTYSNNSVGSFLVRATSVPEPSIIALIFTGLFGLGFARVSVNRNNQ